MFSFGIILVEFLDEFGGSRLSTAFVGAIGFGTLSGLGPIVGSLVDKFGSRLFIITGSLLSFAAFLASAFVTSLAVMCLTYGLLGGIGFGLMWLPAEVCIIKYFNQRRALAIGLASCGTGFGTFGFNLILNTLITEYGWRMTMLIVSGILLNCIPCGLLINFPNTMRNRKEQRQPDQERYDKQHKECGNNALVSVLHSFKDMVKENLRLLKNKRCFFLMASSFFMSLAFMIPFSLLPDQVRQSGLSKTDASWLVSSIGICNIIGRLVIGWLADKPCCNRRVLFEIMLVTQGISIALMPPLPTLETKLIMTCLFGVSFGGYFVLLPLILTDEFGPEQIGKSFGLNMFIFAVTLYIGVPLAGWLYDVTHNYNLSFYLGGAECGVAAIFILIPQIISIFTGGEGLFIESTHL